MLRGIARSIGITMIIAFSACSPARNESFETPTNTPETGVVPRLTATVQPTAESPTPSSTTTTDAPEAISTVEVIETGLFDLVSELPIIAAGDGGDWAKPLHNPGALTFYNGRFHMFRNGYPSLPGSAAIGYATSIDGVQWEFDQDSPVFHSDDVPYAERMIMASSVHVEADGTWVLYFLIWDAASAPGAIGRATAPGPHGPWTPDPAPVLQPGGAGTWDAGQVTHPIVLPNDSGVGYLMYYTGVDESDLERIGLATSPDGITWTKYDNPETTSTLYVESDPLLEPGSPGEWDEDGAARGRVVRSPDGYVMVYRTPARLRGYTYGLAVSADGIHWAKIADNPILRAEDIPRASGLFFPSFIYQDGTYYFYIESFTGSVSQIHLLTRSAPLEITTLTQREDTLSAVNLQVSDIANQGNASDLEVRFDSALDGTQIKEYRLILVKSENAVELDLESASNLQEQHYTPIHNEANFIRSRLGEDSLDVEGDAITEGVAYVAYVLSVGETGSSLSPPSKEIVLANELSVHTLVEKLPSATGGLAVDRDGNLYAANIGRAPSRSGSEIYRISPQGDIELWVSGQGLRGASGNTFDAQGNLYQSSLSANIIHRITPDGAISVFASDGIDGPVGIVSAPDGSLFVANCRGDSVVRISPQGEVTLFAESALFSCPNGITLDEQGNLYVANFTGGRVLKISPQGEVQGFADVPGGNNGHILYHDDLLYVVSRGGHQIYTLTLEGELTPLAGSGERGHQDGPAGQATFSLPNDIIASPDGQRLYVNEVLPTSGSTNIPSVIRVIELPRQ